MSKEVVVEIETREGYWKEYYSAEEGYRYQPERDPDPKDPALTEGFGVRLISPAVKYSEPIERTSENTDGWTRWMVFSDKKTAYRELARKFEELRKARAGRTYDGGDDE